jgi:teichuronic acid exporter
MSVVRQAITALRWNLLMRVAGQVLAWCMTVLIMRVVTPADVGLVAMTGVFADSLNTVAELGLASFIVQAPDLPRRTLRQVFGLVLLFNSAAAAFLYACAGGIALLYREPRLLPLVRLVSVQFVIAAFGLVPQALAMRALNFKVVSAVQLAASLSNVGLTLVLALQGYGAWALLIGNVAGAAVQSLAINLVCPFAAWPVFSFNGMRKVLSFGGKLAAGRLLWSFWSEADTFIGGRMLGKAPLGVYSVAKQFASLPGSKLSQIVTQVAFPAFSRLQDERDTLRLQLIRSIRLIALISYPALWGMSCVAADLVLMTLGPRWAAAILPLQIIAVIMPLRIISQFSASAIQGVGRADIDFENNLACIITLPAAFWIGSRWGVAGMSAVWVVFFPFLWWWMMRRSFAAVGLTVTRVLRETAWPAFAAAVMCAAVFGVGLLVPLPAGNWRHAAALVLTGAAVYAALIAAFDRPDAAMLLRLVRSMLPSRSRDVAAASNP